MKNYFYKLIDILIILIIISNILAPLQSIANSSLFSKYVAMGDSIAYGYGLSNRDTQSYAQIVRSKLNIPASNFQNIAVSGMTCKEYYEKITTDTSYQDSIKSADLITVSIGSNELLGIAINAVSNVTGISSNDSDFEEKAKNAFLNANRIEQLRMLHDIYSYFTSNEIKQQINLSISTYTEYWEKSYQYIKTINPNVTLVATQFYNPYYEISLLSYDLGGFVDEPIVKMNRILEEKSDSGNNYKIAKIYNDFNTTNPRLTNVNISLADKQFMLDPHPNITGHSKIATRILDVLSSLDTKTDISKLNISEVTDCIYTGNEITPQIEIKDNNYTLIEDKDYTVIYIDNINIGQAKISITGIGNYSGNIIKTFNINQSQNEDITNASISPIEDQIYTGYKIIPTIEIKNNNTILEKNKDYILTYQNNIYVGEANVIIKGIGNYSGTLTKKFNIVPKSISETSISPIKDQLFNGSEIQPDIQISDGSSKLILNNDYKLSYSNNINEGTATVTIEGINNYQGKTTTTFKIIKNTTSELKDIANVICTEISDKIYTGKLITPEVTLTDNDYILIKDKDYSLSYTNNLNIGTGLLTITGLGDYTGTIVKSFNILKKDINNTLIDDIKNQIYTGKEITPNVTITSDFIQLKVDQDYIIEYTNNVEPGTALIKITGINNYTGEMAKSFNIINQENNNANSNNNTNSNNTNSNNANSNNANSNNTDSNKTNAKIADSKNNAQKVTLPYTGYTRVLSICCSIFFLISMIINFVKYKNNNF